MIRSRGLLVMLMSVAFAGCAGPTAQEPAICQQDLAAARSENARLRERLARAPTPARLTLSSPDIVELVGGSAPDGSVETNQGPPTLDPRDASRVVLSGASALQRCYGESLRTNLALREQKGLSVLLQMTVAPTGAVTRVDITPPMEPKLIDCFRAEIRAWIFPQFAGSSLIIEQKLILTPK